jgi:hypothetical protein
MADLICYIPNHGYSNDDHIYVSWLDGEYYVSDKDDNSFKLATTAGGAELVEYSEIVVDGYVRQVAAAGVTSITGLDHLEGETVKLTSRGKVIATEVVSSGAITLTSGVYNYQVGLPYKMKVRTMRLAVPPPSTIQTRIKRIISTVVRHIKSVGGRAGQEYDGVEYLGDINATYSTDSKDTPKDDRLTFGGFSEDAYVTIVSDEPLPFTVLATIIEVEVEGK